jgi:hypothetical protein
MAYGKPRIKKIENANVKPTERNSLRAIKYTMKTRGVSLMAIAADKKTEASNF